MAQGIPRRGKTCAMILSQKIRGVKGEAEVASSDDPFVAIY